MSLSFRVVLAALALSLPSSPVSAASWWLVQVGPSSLFFVDMETITVEGDGLTYWQQVVERDTGVDTVTSSKQQWRADCSRRVQKLKHAFFYDRAGRAVASNSGPLPEQPAVPDSIGSSILNFVCNPFEYSDTPAMVIAGSPQNVAADAFALSAIDGVHSWAAAGLAVAASHGELGQTTWDDLVNTLPAAAQLKVRQFRRDDATLNER